MTQMSKSSHATIKRTVILFVDRLIDQFLIDQETMEFVCYDFVSQRREVSVEELV
jgi:hypothetical protein